MGQQTATVIRTRRGRSKPYSGTLGELVAYFAYNLAGERPTTFSGLVDALNRQAGELRRGSYEPDRYRLRR